MVSFILALCVRRLLYCYSDQYVLKMSSKATGCAFMTDSFELTTTAKNLTQDCQEISVPSLPKIHRVHVSLHFGPPGMVRTERIGKCKFRS